MTPKQLLKFSHNYHITKEPIWKQLPRVQIFRFKGIYIIKNNELPNVKPNFFYFFTNLRFRFTIEGKWTWDSDNLLTFENPIDAMNYLQKNSKKMIESLELP